MGHGGPVDLDTGADTGGVGCILAFWGGFWSGAAGGCGCGRGLGSVRSAVIWGFCKRKPHRITCCHLLFLQPYHISSSANDMSCLNTTSPHFARKGGLHAVITERHLGHAETHFAQVLQGVPPASVLALHEQWVRNIPPKYCKTQALFAEGGQQLSLSFPP